ncbi:MAG: HupE/UreJ family protein [Nitrospira sp.]|nr:HupE/UreJ family protein [Nitrospira sp.]
MKHLFLAAASALLLTQPAWAHKSSDSYLSLRLHDHLIEGQWDIALRDLDDAIGLDRDDDGAVTWGETNARHAAIAAYALSRLTLTIGEAACATAVTEHLIDHHTDGAYAVLRFTAACPPESAPLAVDYRLLFDLDAQHKGLLHLTYEHNSRTAIFSQDVPAQTFTLEAPSAWQEIRQYLREGIWHIWTGFDHLLFLLTLLLPSVLIQVNGRWQAVETFSSAAREAAAIVTAFTAAHSLTLSLATLDIVQLPSRLVESTIAASVILAGIANLYPEIARRRWPVAFAFGLIHGFGFASVLSDLGLPREARVLSLVSFNVGVELGQLAIVALFLPLAYGIRHSSSYQPLIVRAGSVIIILIALIWLIERALNLTLLPI